MNKQAEKEFEEMIEQLKEKYPSSRYPSSLKYHKEKFQSIKKAIEKLSYEMDRDHEEDRMMRAEDGWKSQYEEDADAKSRGGIGLAMWTLYNKYYTYGKEEDE